MKRIRICSLGLLAALVCFGINAYAADPGSIKIKILATSQALDGLPSYTTNSSSTVTNYTTESKYTTSNSVIDNTRLLQMLTNSLNTNFPAGTALELSEAGSIILVSGTNVQDISSVLSLTLTNKPVMSGSMSSKERIAPGGTTSTGSFIITTTSAATLTYNDSALTTGDGSTTRLTMTGLEEARLNLSGSGELESVSLVVDFSGTGSGSTTNKVSKANTDFILRATAVGAVSIKEVPVP